MDTLTRTSRCAKLRLKPTVWPLRCWSSGVGAYSDGGQPAGLPAESGPPQGPASESLEAPSGSGYLAPAPAA